MQIAKAFGAEVTGVCSTAKTDMVRAIGADHIVDYTAKTSPMGSVATTSSSISAATAGCRSSVEPSPRQGRLVIVGGETDGRWLGGFDRQIRALLLSLVVSQKLGTLTSSENSADLVALRELIESGKVTPVIDKTYPLGDVPVAIRYMSDGNSARQGRHQRLSGTGVLSPLRTLRSALAYRALTSDLALTSRAHNAPNVHGSTSNRSTHLAQTVPPLSRVADL